MKVPLQKALLKGLYDISPPRIANIFKNKRIGVNADSASRCTKFIDSINLRIKNDFKANNDILNNHKSSNEGLELFDSFKEKPKINMSKFNYLKSRSNNHKHMFNNKSRHEVTDSGSHKTAINFRTKNDFVKDYLHMNFDHTRHDFLRPYSIRRRKYESNVPVIKMIDYLYKDWKRNEVMSKFNIEFWPDSNFNTILRYYNEFILATTKRIDANYDMEFIKQLWRLINSTKPKVKIDSDLINDFKSTALESLLYHINSDNKMLNNNLQLNWLSTKYDFQRKTSFKAYICKGNNGRIVKTVLKKRWWWTLVDKCNPEECDFIWTQWLKPKVVNQIYKLNHDTIDSDYKNNSVIDQQSKLKKTCIYSKIEKNHNLANKKNLFLNLRWYYKALGKDPNSYIPMTYLILKGPEHESFQEFIEETKSMSKSKLILLIKSIYRNMLDCKAWWEYKSWTWYKIM